MKHPFNRPTSTPKKQLLYNRWINIKQCVNNPNHPNYHLYGGKEGNPITICKEWENNYLEFLLWCIKSGFKKDLILTRKDKNKGFEPSNCVWSENTHKTKSFNIA